MQLCFLVVFPNQQEFSYLTCTVSSRTASRVQRKIQPGWHLPTLQLPFWWCKHNSASGEFNMDLCAERVQRLGKLSCALQTTQMKISQHELFCCMTLSPHGTSVKWKRSCMITDITTQTMYTIIAW